MYGIVGACVIPHDALPFAYVYSCRGHRLYSRQVREQLHLSGSFHSQQLVYLKAGNVASSENH